MKIADIKLHLSEIPLSIPYPSTWNPGNPETKLFISMVEVITDDGIHGYAAACDSSQLLAGIWDSHMGKYCDLPIYKLLGGAKDRVLAYASTGSLKSTEERIEDMERFISEGFTMMKLRAHHDDPWEDLKVIEKVIAAANGRIQFGVDANQAWFFTGKKSVAKWDLKKAIRFAHELEDLGVIWLEEPLHQFDYEGLAELRASTSISIAGGEINSHMHQFRDFIKYGCYDIYNTDPTFVGGFHVARKVTALIEAENKLLAPHTWTHGYGLAASLQLAASTDCCPFIEYCYDPPAWEYTQRDVMLTEPIRVDSDGYITMSQKPGLGVDPNMELIDRYSVLKL